MVDTGMYAAVKGLYMYMYVYLYPYIYMYTNR